jgi:hypothetical protein
MAMTREPLRRPDFSVVVWIRKNERFAAVRSELLAAANAQPYETTEYQGMADFHFAMDSMVVVLRIMSLVEGVDSISIKDERVTKH